MSIQLRRATAEDFLLILELMKQYYEFDHLPYDREVIKAALDVFIAKPELGSFWMIHPSGGSGPSSDHRSDHSAVAGYMIITFGFSFEWGGSQAIIDELYIRPEFRAQGFGSAALKHAEAVCEEAGTLVMRLEVTEENRRALKIYESFGFKSLNRSLMIYPLSSQE